MKHYDFDKTTPRTGTCSVKYDGMGELYGREDLIPLWVADMDFETPPFIIEALRRRLEHPVLGYTFAPDSYWQAVIDWIGSHHGWRIRREWMTFIPGVVKGIGMAVNALTAPDDRIVIQPPVYHPFRRVPELNGREVVCNPLLHVGDRYEMDFDGLERVLEDPRCRVLVLANPHNPIGIVWPRETLMRLASVCARRGVTVISDEIHCDLALYGHRHIPFASVSDEAARCSITFGAPTKTFNMAGVVSSYAIVPDRALRERFYAWLEANELDMPQMFAPIAAEAAFRYGEEWRRQLIAYIEANIDFVDEYLRERLPQVRVVKPEASYLVWLDCRGLGLTQPELVDLFVNEARLALNDGAMFGVEGEGYMRLNVGTQRAVLVVALDRLVEAAGRRR